MSSIVEDTSINVDAVAAFQDLQRRLGDMLVALPGPVRRASQLHKALCANYRVCWQVFEVVKATDALAGVRHVPRPGSMQKMLAAAGNLGVSTDIVHGVRTALERFDRIAKTHAANREAFATMMESMSGKEADDTGAVACRRAAFRQESQIWGSQVGVFFGRMCLGKDENGGEGYSSCLINLKAGFQCLRAGVRPIVRGGRTHNREGVPTPGFEVQPLDPQAQEKYGVPLLPEFCTRPLPELVRIKSEDGWYYDVLANRQLGRSGAVNIASGTRRARSPRTTLPDGRNIIWTAASVVTPTELGIFELAVHRPTFGKVVPSVRMAPERGHSFLSEITAPVPQIPALEKVVDLGPADRVPPPVEVSDYTQLCSHAFDLLGWEESEFDVYRVMIPYPILHCMVVMWFPIA